MAMHGLDKKLTFRRQTVDQNGEASGFEDVATRMGKVEPLKGQESVQASRMAGEQPVRIRVRQDSLTEQIDNSWQVKDFHKPEVSWDIYSAFTEDRFVVCEAKRHMGGDVQ